MLDVVVGDGLSGMARKDVAVQGRCEHRRKEGYEVKGYHAEESLEWGRSWLTLAAGSIPTGGKGLGSGKERGEKERVG